MLYTTSPALSKKIFFFQFCFKNPSGSVIYAGLTVQTYIRLYMYLHIVDLCLRQYCMQFFMFTPPYCSVMFLKIIILCGTINTEMKDKLYVYTYTLCIIIWLNFQIVLLSRQIFPIHKMKHNYITYHFYFVLFGIFYIGVRIFFKKPTHWCRLSSKC
jgi:hypothetical protein